MAKSRAARAADPNTPLADLAALAHEHPDLRPIVAANPSTYPDLLAWLGELGDPDVDAALATRTTAEPSAEITTDLLRAGDPSTPQEELAKLAHEHPELRATIAANPNAYDDLRAWIAEAEAKIPPAARADATAEGANEVTTTKRRTKAATTVAAIAAVPEETASPSKATPAPSKDKAAVTTAPPDAEPRPRLPIAVFFATLAARWVALGLTGAQTALVAGAVVVGLVAAGGNVYNIVRAPTTVQTIGAVASGDTSGLPGGSGGSGTDGTGSDGGAQPIAAPEPRYIPTVLILDASGSMVRDVPGGGTRMQAAKAAATTLVEGFGDDAQVGLTVFGTSTGNSDAERAAGCSDIRRLVPVGALDRNALTTAIAGIRESGFTPIGPSLRDAVDQLAGADEGLIVVVSDGVDTCAPPSSCDVAAELRAANPNITIHAVGFAVDADEQAQENLECVAQAGGGTYVDASNADQLAARLRALTDPIATAGTVGVSGIDAVEMGMSMQQVEALLGDLGDTETILDIQYVDCSYGRLGFKDGRLWSIDPIESIPTSEGLAVGDDLAAATAIYGAGTPGEDAEGTYTTYQAAPGSESAYRFYYTGSQTNGTIVHIVVCLCGTGGGGTSEISNWLVTFDGVGPLALDSTFEEADALVAGPLGPGAAGCTYSAVSDSGLGSQVFFTSYQSGPDRVALIYIGGLFGMSAPGLPRTDRGVGIGSTVAEWLEAYPDMTEVNDQSSGRYLILTDAKGVSLIADDPDLDGTIEYVQVGRPDLILTAFCD